MLTPPVLLAHRFQPKVKTDTLRQDQDMATLVHRRFDVSRLCSGVNGQRSSIFIFTLIGYIGYVRT